MDQSTPPEPPPIQSASDLAAKINFSFLQQRLMGLVQNTEPTMQQFRSEHETVTDLYQKYLVALIAIPAVCQFIGVDLLGPGTIFGGIGHLILRCLFGLIGVYLGMLLVQQVSPYFGGSTSQTDILKWIICSHFITAVAGSLVIFAFIPILGSLVGLISLLIALYAIYVSWIGIPIFLDIPSNKRLPFFLTLVACAIAIAFLLSMFGLVGMAGVSTPPPV